MTQGDFIEPDNRSKLNYDWIKVVIHHNMQNLMQHSQVPFNMKWRQHEKILLWVCLCEPATLVTCDASQYLQRATCLQEGVLIAFTSRTTMRTDWDALYTNCEWRFCHCFVCSKFNNCLWNYRSFNFNGPIHSTIARLQQMLRLLLPASAQKRLNNCSRFVSCSLSLNRAAQYWKSRVWDCANPTHLFF